MLITGNCNVKILDEFTNSTLKSNYLQKFTHLRMYLLVLE